MRCNASTVIWDNVMCEKKKKKLSTIAAFSSWNLNKWVTPVCVSVCMCECVHVYGTAKANGPDEDKEPSGWMELSDRITQQLLKTAFNSKTDWILFPSPPTHPDTTIHPCTPPHPRTALPFNLSKQECAWMYCIVHLWRTALFKKLPNVTVQHRGGTLVSYTWGGWQTEHVLQMDKGCQNRAKKNFKNMRKNTLKWSRQKLF